MSIQSETDSFCPQTQPTWQHQETPLQKILQPVILPYPFLKIPL